MHFFFCYPVRVAVGVFFLTAPSRPPSLSPEAVCVEEFWSFIPPRRHPAPLHIMYIETVDEWMMLPSSASQLWKPTEHSSMTRELQMVINHSSGSFLFRLPSLFIITTPSGRLIRSYLIMAPFSAKPPIVSGDRRSVCWVKRLQSCYFARCYPTVSAHRLNLDCCRL